jgi:hypothetical protein
MFECFRVLGFKCINLVSVKFPPFEQVWCFICIRHVEDVPIASIRTFLYVEYVEYILMILWCMGMRKG